MKSAAAAATASGTNGQFPNHFEIPAKNMDGLYIVFANLPPPTGTTGGSSSATQRVSPQQATSEASAIAAAAAVGSAAAADVAVTESRTIYKVRAISGNSGATQNDIFFLSKVKRFLCTLIQFGTEISAETGEKVKELVFNLVVSLAWVSHYFFV